MKLPSIYSLSAKSLATFKRFPFVLLFAFICTAIAMYLTEYQNKIKDGFIEHSLKLVLCSYLGMLLFLSMKIFLDVKKKQNAVRSMFYIGGLLLLVAYYFTLPTMENFNMITGTRFALFTIAFHLLISFIAFAGKEQTNGFWQFNKILFLRILTAAIYTGVLYSGLALALVAIETLFNLDIYKNIYLHLWFFMIGIFNTWFFLAGIPEDFELLENTHDYPKGLKLFTQYVLLPLVIIYMLILYAYGIKILVEWNLPKGWVSYLIIAFSITGILSLLLIYPIQNLSENRWIKTFSKGFYIALFPLIILLFLAIYKRTSDYGITEERYFVVIVAGWLFCMSLYFSLSKKKNIKVIPISLCIIAFLSSFGPWGAFSIAAKSQELRFKNILAKYPRLKNGKIIQGKNPVSFSDRKNLSSIVSFFDDRNETKAIQQYFPVSLDSILNDSLKYTHPKRIMALLGLDYVYEYQSELYSHISFYSSNSGLMDIKGYDYGLDFNYYQSQRDTSTFGQFRINFDSSRQEININSAGRPMLKIPVDSCLNALRQKYGNGDGSEIPKEELSMISENNAMKAKLVMTSISAEKVEKNKKSLITNINGQILIKIKE